MVDTKQLDAVLAEWRDATTPLDGKRSVDPSFFLPSTTVASSSSRHLGLQRTAGVTTAQLKSSDAMNHGGALRAELLETSCRPWSHEDFLRRASSFSIGTWFAKPDMISVFACARHGWSNTAQPDQLFCACCEQFLCLKIDPKLSEKGVLQVAGAFAKLLATGHSTLCPWRENPSPEAFTTLPIASPEQVCASLVKRMEQFLAAAANTTTLFDLVRSLRINAGTTKKILSEAAAWCGTTESCLDALKNSLVTKFEDLLGAQAHDAGNNDSVSEFLLNVALLSICGWQLEDNDSETNEGAALAWCETCNRRWSLSSLAAFAPSSSANTVELDDDDSNEIEPVERSAKRQKVAHAAVLDPVAQHRWFCPWVAARKQEASHERGVMSDELAKYGENDAKLWEFMLLPGWRQYAQALRLLMVSTSSTQDESGTGSSGEASGRPEQALESVRAVLGLPDW